MVTILSHATEPTSTYKQLATFARNSSRPYSKPLARPLSKEPFSVQIGASLPPVPLKLEEKFQYREYLDVFKLLPDKLCRHVW